MQSIELESVHQTCTTMEDRSKMKTRAVDEGTQAHIGLQRLIRLVKVNTRPVRQ